VKAATTNVQNAISYVQTADGFMSGMTKILSRMSELAILAKDVTKNASDIALYQQEFSALQDQLRATIGGTTAEIGGTANVDTPLGAFNGITLFGSNSAGLTVTIGQAVGQDMKISESNLRTGGMLEIIEQDSGGAYLLASDDADAIQKITDAIQHVAQQRATLGAAQSRLELASTTLHIEFENLSSAISRIRDVDVAEESTQYAKYNILVQSGTAMLAQANQTPSSVLKLLQG
jgi:flagellin